MDEGTLVTWAKKEGDEVDIDDLLAEVETDKATMEFRSFDRGVLLKILVPEGATLAPDTPVAIIGKEGEDISALLAEAGGGGEGAAKESKGAKSRAKAKAKSKKVTDEESDDDVVAEDDDEAAGDDAADDEAADDEDGDAADDEEADDEADDEPAKAKRSASNGDGWVRTSPLVRRLAREKDVDLGEVEGTGPRGRVVKRDLEAYLAGGGKSAKRGAKKGKARAPSQQGKERVEKVSQMRKTIARRLTESKRDVPHYYLTIDIDVEPLQAARAAINAELERDKEKISLNDLLIKGCAVALRRAPNVNASFRGDTIVYHDRVDISVAVAIPDGLITPVVRDADRKGVAEIGREVRELAGRARDKKLQPEEFTDGTFSISNLGMYGIEEFTAVINPPEGAILAVGTIRHEPVVKGGAVVPGQRMRMTMSCDHRVIDGAVGAEFLAVLKRLLEAPATMLV
jgi:pyruvate dehydrogenase E2 component (dihydrolipoamide acetyltransferase)